MRKIQIFTDALNDTKYKENWGDYWVKVELMKAISKYGWKESDQKPVYLYFWNANKYNIVDKDARNFIWIYSDFYSVPMNFLKKFTIVFTASITFYYKLSTFASTISFS